MTSQIGKYQIIRPLAGDLIEEYLAKVAGPRGSEQTLVLKCLGPALAEDVELGKLFLDEARLAARLTHPHIERILDVGEADGKAFIAVESIDGPNLRMLIHRAAAQRRTLPATLCARIISQACEGLAFAHDFTHPETPRGFIHRHINPAHILLSRQGTAKMVDFVIARVRSFWRPSCYSGVVITGHYVYMPPEALRGREMDRRVDVYALGVVLYELLTARKPFEHKSELELLRVILSEPLVPAERHRPDLPEPLRAILARALAQDPDQRYPDCHAFRADLEEFLLSVGEPVTPEQVAQFLQQVTASGGAVRATPP